MSFLIWAPPQPPAGFRVAVMLPPDESVAQRRPIVYEITRRGGLADAVVLTASFMFLLGSIFFLPHFWSLVDFNITCWIFASGSLVFTLILPAYALAATTTFEYVATLLFIVVMIPFDVGLVFFFPGVAEAVGSAGVKAGLDMFIFGCSVILAASIGGVGYMAYQQYTTKAPITYAKGSEWFQAISALIGTVCFFMGSLDLLSDDLHTSLVNSAWSFVIGSALFCAIAVMPYVDMIVNAKMVANDSAPLLAPAAADAGLQGEKKEEENYKTFTL